MIDVVFIVIPLKTAI